MVAPYQTQPCAAALALPGQAEVALLCNILDALLGVTGGPIAPTPVTPFPATIAGGVTYDSGVISAGGFNQFAASAKLDQTGTLTLTRYIDAAGTIQIATLAQAMVANTLATVAVNDGIPCASWRVTIANTSGSLGTLTQAALLERK